MSKTLQGCRVVLTTSGHDATDHRIYDKEAKSLSAAGASVSIIGSHHAKNGDKIPARIIPTPRATNRIQRFLLQPWRCWFQASNLKADIVHIHDAELLQIAPWIRLMKPDTKLVYDVHEDFANIVTLRRYIPEALKPLSKMTVNLMEKSFAKLAHGIVGVTDPLAASFRNRHQIAVYNYPSHHFYQRARRFSRPSAQRTYDLVHLGTLSQERAEFLAMVLRILHQRRPSTKSLITGAHAPILAYLDGRVPPGCDLEGKLQYTHVPAKLGDARIGIDIHPFNTPNLDVAVPVKVFEYMASGCAVVTSMMPVLDRLLAQGAIGGEALIPISGGTPEMFAHAVENLLELIAREPDIGKKLQSKAQSQFVWEAEAEKLIDFYLEILN